MAENLHGSPSKLEKSVFISELKAKDSVQSTFLVKSKGLPLAKNGRPYLAMHLKDRTGEIDARLWDDAERIAAEFKEGDIIAVGGKVNSFQNRLQLIVDHLTAMDPKEVDLRNYLPRAEADLDGLYEELVDAFRGMENPWIQKVSLALLENREIAERYKVCPAGKSVHHAYLGGLLVHSLQLIKVAEVVLPFYPYVNRDLVVFGCAFHDFGKIYELSYHSDFSYTDEGRLVGHLSIANVLVDREIQKIPDFPNDLEWQLKHLILSHHGKLEYGSPKEPHTVEAMMVSMLDNLDSKMDSIASHIKNDKSPFRWTPLHRTHGKYYFKPDTLMTPS